MAAFSKPCSAQFTSTRQVKASIPIKATLLNLERMGASYACTRRVQAATGIGWPASRARSVSARGLGSQARLSRQIDSHEDPGQHGSRSCKKRTSILKPHLSSIFVEGVVRKESRASVDSVQKYFAKKVIQGVVSHSISGTNRIR